MSSFVVFFASYVIPMDSEKKTVIIVVTNFGRGSSRGEDPSASGRERGETRLSLPETCHDGQKTRQEREI